MPVFVKGIPIPNRAHPNSRSTVMVTSLVFCTTVLTRLFTPN
jgi:hypothetical protein